METVRPFLAQSEETLKNADFMGLLASLITSGWGRTDRTWTVKRGSGVAGGTQMS